MERKLWLMVLPQKAQQLQTILELIPDLVECIYDTTPIKQNKYSPGAHIPVLPYDQFRDSNPDYVLLFAWNHAEEIMKKSLIIWAMR